MTFFEIPTTVRKFNLRVRQSSKVLRQIDRGWLEFVEYLMSLNSSSELKKTLKPFFGAVNLKEWSKDEFSFHLEVYEIISFGVLRTNFKKYKKVSKTILSNVPILLPRGPQVSLFEASDGCLVAPWMFCGWSSVSLLKGPHVSPSKNNTYA